MLESQLDGFTGIRVIPVRSTRFALRELQMGSNETVVASRAKSLGEFDGAGWVVWGTYNQEGGVWTLTSEVLNVVTGEAPKEITAVSPNLFAAVSNISGGLLREMGAPSNRDRPVTFPLPTSVEALEFASHARASMLAGKALTNCEDEVRRGLSLDPNFGPGLELLARILVMENRLDEAKEAATRAVNAHPDYAAAHSVLGVVYASEGLLHLARDEYLEAMRLDNYQPEYRRRLSEIYNTQNKWDDAKSVLLEAEEMAPYDASVHATLAIAYFYLGAKDKCLGELEAGEREEDPGWEDLAVDQTLGLGFELVNELPRAAEHYERFLSRSMQAGLRSGSVDQVQARLAYLKARLVPEFLSCPAPKSFTKEDLQNALSALLTPKQCALVTNPLESTPGMKEWANRLVTGTDGDLKKAERLFDGLLVRRIDPWAMTARRTAQQTFDAWHDSNVSFTCEDYAFLYVSLAREVGLNAYYVQVMQDYRGLSVPHACAGVFIGDRALLVDASYRWFGVPHKAYRFLDDLQTIGMYLAGSADIPKLEIGLLLATNEPAPRFALAFCSATNGLLKEAREKLNSGLKLDSASWPALYTKAVVEAKEEGRDLSVADWKMLARAYPEYPDAHYGLAVALHRAHRLEEARDEYRKYLVSEPQSQYSNVARKSVVDISETLSHIPATSTQSQYATPSSKE